MTATAVVMTADEAKIAIDYTVERFLKDGCLTPE
jgi:hypothetical protein